MNFILVKLSSSPFIYTLILSLFLNSLRNFSWDIMNTNILIYISTLFLYYLIYKFFYILIKENFFIGFYTEKKKFFLINGFIIFILSELIVFLSLFWSYIHNAFTPNIYLGNYWPPKGVIPSNPTRIIIFGTVILLRSRFIIIISHNSILLKNSKIKTIVYLFICIFIGLIFIDIQVLEIRNYFIKLNFNFNDRIFRRSFLVTTSLHASHVFIGLLGLIYSFILININFNNIKFYLNFEFSIWYWHFVDYIWIIVFSLFYYFNS